MALAVEPALAISYHHSAFTMIRISVTLAITSLLVVLASWTDSSPAAARRNAVRSIAERSATHTLVQAQHLIDILTHKGSAEEVRFAYESLRAAFKHFEPIITYADPSYTTDHLNGAPLPRLDNKSQFPDVLQPEGLQVIDELVSADTINHAEIAERVSAFAAYMEGAMRTTTGAPWTDRMLIELCRTAVMRVTTMGITGFDRPASEPQIADDTAALQLVHRIMSLFDDGNKASDHIVRTADSLVRRAIDVLRDNPPFDEFDRMEFIRRWLEPLYGALVDVQTSRGIEFADEVSPVPSSVNVRARSMFATNTLNPFLASGFDARHLTADRVNLGRMLFFDPVLSSSNDRACASCHDPSIAFTDGRPKSLALGLRGTIDRNAPTLINAAFSTRFFYDLRAKRLNDVVSHVVTHDLEFGSTLLDVLARLNASTEYRALFAQAFPNDSANPITVSTLGLAISSYLATLVSFNSPVDQYLRGERASIDASVRRGFNLFHGRAACATCHFPPTYSGLVPPTFTETESEILGVPTRPDTTNATLDPDPGRAAGIVRENHAIYRHSFKTPTIRNAALTAPYMHNGAYPTLEQVVQFYDVGGGRGIGIPLEYQTLAADRLNFSRDDYNDLIAFMKALTDTTGLASRPQRLPVLNDAARNKRTIGGEY